jgi:serine/threonine-protein kinase RsbW
VDAAPPGLHFTITDDGAAMPTGRLPGGNTADPSREAHEQEEGGYGLHLIREVARKLRYERTETRNRLSFRIPLSER